MKAKPEQQVVLLEARAACSGATARNGGHLRPSVYSRLSRLVASYSEKDAVEVADFELSHVKAIADLVDRERIGCDFELTKSFDVHTDPVAAERAKNDYLELKEKGIAKSTIDDLTWYDGEEAEKVSGVKGCVGCFLVSAAKLWPYKLCMHLCSLALNAGLSLQTHTPATSISQCPTTGSWIVTTSRGSISAKKLIIATNGFAHALLPEYKSKIYPARGICCRIVFPEGKDAPRLQRTYTIRLPRESHDYLIQRPDGSIVVGGARSAFFADHREWLDNTDDGTLIKPAKHYFDAYMQTHFHEWEESGARVDSIWTGIMGYCSDSLPHVGEVPGRKGCWIAAGFEGHGMPVVWLAMRGIALMVSRGVAYSDSGVPNLYKTTAERLNSSRNDLTARIPDPNPHPGGESGQE